MTSSPQPSAIALLAWYQAMGVDEAIADTPTDWFAVSARPVRAPETPALRPPMQSRARPARPRPANATLAPDEAVSDARARAASAATLEELRQAVESFEGCGLKTTAKHTCFKRGSDQARVMMIGEAPGRDEDLQGAPFVGRAGQLLDQMLAAIGLSEDDVYITNIVYWRPPGNRTPSAPEVEACRPFLMRQIELLDPEIIVLIGGPASQSLLGTTEGITRLRGKWREVEVGGKMRRVLPTLHPAYLLRTPAAKRLAWRDLLAIEDALKEQA